MELTNPYLQNLAKYVQSYILNNNNRFGQEEYLDVLCNLCILENIKIKEECLEQDFSKRLSLIKSRTDEMISFYMIAAEKLLASLYINEFDYEVAQRVYNWTFEPNAKTKFLNFNKKFYNIDYSKDIESYF